MLEPNCNSIGASKAERFRYSCNIWTLCRIVSIWVCCGCHIWCSTPYQDFKSSFSDDVWNVLALISLTSLLVHQCIQFSNLSWIVAKMKGFETEGCVRQRVLTASVIIIHCSGCKVLLQGVRQFSTLVLSCRVWSRSESWEGGCFALLVHSERICLEKTGYFNKRNFFASTALPAALVRNFMICEQIASGKQLFLDELRLRRFWRSFHLLFSVVHTVCIQ